jgi:peptidoglycan/xylan/chitin deacetylase (PgdA/CDA1 family)
MSAQRARWLGVAVAALTGALIGASFGGRSAVGPVAPAAAEAAVSPTVTASARATTSPSRTTTTSITTTTTTTDAPDCPAPQSKAITEAPGTGRTVALTFDDGPGADTEALLAVLRAHHVHATFFMVGREAAAHPELVAAVAADGHLIGDHSWDHRYPKQVTGGWTRSWLQAGMADTNGAVDAAGGGPVCWFRPPGGFLPKTVLPAARSKGMSVVLWSVDPQDWKIQAPHAGTTQAQRRALIVQRVAAGIGQPHPVVLMHDGGGDRRAGVAAVGEIIERYRAHGYRFVRLDGQR